MGVRGENILQAGLKLAAGQILPFRAFQYGGRTQLLVQCRAVWRGGGLEEAAVDPRVKSAAGGVVIGVFPLPAIEMPRGVQRLRGVAHEMAQDAHAINDVGARIGYLRIGSHFLEHFQIGKRADKLEVIFVDRPRQKARVPFEMVGIGLGQLQLQPGARGGHLFHEAVAEMTEVSRFDLVRLEIFHIEIVVGIIEVPQGAFAVVSPAVRFAPEEEDALPRGRREGKAREILGQRAEREIVNQPVPLVVPRPEIAGDQQHTEQPG